MLLPSKEVVTLKTKKFPLTSQILLEDREVPSVILLDYGD